MSPPPIPKTLEQRVTELEATDRRHSNTHRGLAENVKKAHEETLQTKRAVTDHGEQQEDALLGAVRILSTAIGDQATASANRHDELLRLRDEDARKIEALEGEMRDVRAALKKDAPTTYGAPGAKYIATSVGDDTVAIRAKQDTQARMAWVRMVLTILGVPALPLIFAALERHC